MATQTATATAARAEQDSVVKAMQSYIDGVRLGKSSVMRPGFHESAMIFGSYPGGMMTHPIQALFDWIDQNGPSPDLKPQFGAIEIRETIASVQLEVRDISGALAGAGVRMSDIFLLLRTDSGWKITQEAFHWYQ
jgi:Putative lumazine-binding